MICIARRASFWMLASVGFLGYVVLSPIASAAVLTGSEKEAPSAFTAALPVGVDPNPPKSEDLNRSNLIWKGEYFGDKLGNPLLDGTGKPLPILYNNKGKRQRLSATIPKLHPAAIVDGTLVVDGWTSKARLNYDIRDLHYLYISAPGLGTLTVSPTPFPGSAEQQVAFTKNALTLVASGHEIQLLTARPILRKKIAQSAYVRLDESYIADGRSPVLGYGRTLTSPYVWPGGAVTQRKASLAPPLPDNMLPKKLSRVCINLASKGCQAKPADADTTPADAADTTLSSIR